MSRREGDRDGGREGDRDRPAALRIKNACGIHINLYIFLTWLHAFLQTPYANCNPELMKQTRLTSMR